MIIDRTLKQQIYQDLEWQSAVVLLGPRQVGKTTLARQIQHEKGAVYLDLETMEDRQRFANVQQFLARHRGTLVILDEVQSVPDLFMELRGAIDKARHDGIEHGQLLLLGSASQALLKQSSESLLGRVVQHELTGVSVAELDANSPISELWSRGGYPRSFLAAHDDHSLKMRRSIYRSLIDRDVPDIAGAIDRFSLEKFFAMMATLNGQEFNAAQIARALDLSKPTSTKYANILTDLMIFRQLKPWYGNGVKRLTKRPRVYMRDSGLLHLALGLSDHNALLGHHAMGSSWEGFVIEQIIPHLDHMVLPHYFRQNDVEVDLVLERIGSCRVAIEIKHASAPTLSKGFYRACEALDPTHKIVIHGGDHSFPMKDGVEALSLSDAIEFVSGL